MDKLASAQLQVVLPGTRAAFRRRVVDALLSLVPASGAFCFSGKDDSRAYAESTRVVDGAVRSVLGARRNLSAAFGFDRGSVVATPRRVYMSAELWPEAERTRPCPYFAECSAPDEAQDGAPRLPPRGRRPLRPRRARAARRSRARSATRTWPRSRRSRPSSWPPRALQMQYTTSFSREAAALRALGNVQGAVFVVDRDRKKVLWAADRQNGIDWDEDVVPERGAARRGRRALARREEARRGDADRPRAHHRDARGRRPPSRTTPVFGGAPGARPRASRRSSTSRRSRASSEARARHRRGSSSRGTAA